MPAVIGVTTTMPLEWITAVVGLLGLIVGFFVNLITMRSMFVSRKEYESCEYQRNCDIREIKDSQKEQNVLLFEMNGTLQRLLGQLEK